MLCALCELALGCSEVVAFSSSTRQRTPRRPRSAASVSPTGPPPTIATLTRMSARSVISDAFLRNRAVNRRLRQLVWSHYHTNCAAGKAGMAARASGCRRGRLRGLPPDHLVAQQRQRRAQLAIAARAHGLGDIALD